MDSSVNIQLLLWYIGVSANVLPILLGLWAWRRMNRLFWAVFGVFIVSGLLALLSTGIIKGLLVSGNMLNYLGPVAYAVLLAFAFSQVIEHRQIRVLIRLFPVALALFLGIMVFFRGIEIFFMWGYAAADSWVLLLSLRWFYEQLTGRPNQSLRAIPWFWINSTLLFEKLYSLFFLFSGQWLHFYHEQLFSVLLYGVSPLIMWGNALVACIGIWKQQQLNKQPTAQTTLI